jgi:tRNA(fMet)-specific endonuclease VapC
MKYLLDTNICIYAINERSDAVVKRLKHEGRENLTTSAVVAAWTEAAIWHYARQRRILKEAGTPIGEMDLLIASHALGDDLTLVTNNTREFERIEGLKLENWAQ